MGNIRFVKISDTEQVLNIYKPYIERTSTSFEYKIPSKDEFSQRINKVISFYPWLVYEEDNEILGYAYASKHREREAYQWSADVSVYLKEEAKRKGIASQLYTQLFSLLKKQGICNLYAGISLPNEASTGLHEKMGFNKIAEFHNVGYKLGKWWNVGYWELRLNDVTDNPTPPIASSLI